MKNIFGILISFIGIGNLQAQNSFTDCGVNGSTTMYDYKNKKWIYTDSLDANKPTLPASTFKIINSLISLETNSINDENEIIRWDKKDKKFLVKVCLFGIRILILMKPTKILQSGFM